MWITLLAINCVVVYRRQTSTNSFYGPRSKKNWMSQQQSNQLFSIFPRGTAQPPKPCWSFTPRPPLTAVSRAHRFQDSHVCWCLHGLASRYLSVCLFWPPITSFIVILAVTDPKNTTHHSWRQKPFLQQSATRRCVSSTHCILEMAQNLPFCTFVLTSAIDHLTIHHWVVHQLLL